MAERMATVKHKILVLSGKGGVGKSTLSAQLSFALAALDYQVGLLDIDLCGPSIPKMLGLEGQANFCSNSGHSPVYVDSNLGVISIGFLLDHPDQPIAIRGPRKTEQIKKFVRGVDWGELDFLVVDAPPGTSDEQISIVQFLQAASTGGGVDGAIVVTTPQQVSLADVRKGVNFCKKVGVPVLGVVENMSGLFQPMSDIRWFERRAGTEDVMGGGERDVTAWVLEHLRDRAPEVLSLTAHCQVFDTRGGGAEKMCSEMEVPFWGKVPLDPQLCKAAEEGKSCFTESSRCGASAPALKRIINKLLAHFTPSMPPPSTQENGGV